MNEIEISIDNKKFRNDVIDSLIFITARWLAEETDPSHCFELDYHENRAKDLIRNQLMEFDSLFNIHPATPKPE